MKKLNKKGFTLIELMIVIAIIAILAAILVPNFVKARAQGQLTACKSNLKNIGTAMEMYASDHNGRYITGLNDLSQSDLTGQGYMKVVPTCPVTNASQYYYTAVENPDYYFLICDKGHHEQAGMRSVGYPQFDSIMGLVAPGSDDSTSMSTYTVGTANL